MVVFFSSKYTSWVNCVLHTFSTLYCDQLSILDVLFAASRVEHSVQHQECIDDTFSADSWLIAAQRTNSSRTFLTIRICMGNNHSKEA